MDAKSVRAAAGRVRASVGGGFSRYVTDAERNRDILAVCDAYLAGCSADDDKPLTPSLLRSFGFTGSPVDTRDIGGEAELVLAMPGGLYVWVWGETEGGFPITVATMREYDGGDFTTHLPDLKTVGDLRRMCRYFGIPLAEATP